MVYGMSDSLAIWGIEGASSEMVNRYRSGREALLAGAIRTRALESFTRMRTLATRTGAAGLEALALNWLSVTHDLLGQRKEALSLAIRARQIARKLGNDRLVALSMNSEAQYYKETGKNQQAFRLFAQVHAIGQKMGDLHLVMGGLIGMGRTTPMHRAPEAIKYYRDAMDLAEFLRDEETLGLCYNNLADWEIAQGNYAEAIRLRESSLQLAVSTGSRLGEGRALIGIAKAETLLGNYHRAWEFLKQGMPLILSVEDMEGVLHCFLNLAHLYAHEGDIPRACDYYQRTLEKSVAAPDAACATFAREALGTLAQGGVPKPGVVPEVFRPDYLYQTGDLKWSGNN